MGTPLGLSNSGDSDAHSAAGVVKRLFGMRGLLGGGRRPRPALPVDGLGRRRVVVPFPPRRAVGPQRDVGVDRVAANHLERRGVGLVARARRDAEEPGLRVHGPQPAVRPGAQPRDVVADGPDLPARHGCRRHQHRQVGLAARGRKGAGHVVHAAVGRLQAENQHVLGEPAFLARHPAGQAQRQALLAQQGIAAVAGPDRPDRVLFGEVHDEPPLGRQVAERVQAAREVVGPVERVEGHRADAGHHPHVQHDVPAVGDLDADLREPRAGRAHQKRARRTSSGPPSSPGTAASASPAPASGAIQLLVGPTASLLAVLMKVRCSVRATSWRRAPMEHAARQGLLVERDELARGQALGGDGARARPPTRRRRRRGPGVVSARTWSTHRSTKVLPVGMNMMTPAHYRSKNGAGSADGAGVLRAECRCGPGAECHAWPGARTRAVLGSARAGVTASPPAAAGSRTPRGSRPAACRRALR